MPRNYRNISMYEKEIIALKRQGCTGKEICAKYGFNLKQYKNFITRYNKKQEKLSSGIAIRKKGRPAKDTVVTEKMKSAQLRYIIARKDAKIKQLEMENELMRDFLSLIERK